MASHGRDRGKPMRVSLAANVPARPFGRCAPTPTPYPSTAAKLSRKSSAMGRGGINADPRPLKDPEFIKSQQELVMAFLESKGDIHGLSAKALCAPSGKEFRIIISALQRVLDPRCRNVPPKVEDQVPTLLRRLRYPFQVSKSALSAVGAPHSWPPILGSVAWLVTCHNYIQHVVTNKTLVGGLGMGGSGTDSALDHIKATCFEYQGRSYRMFIAGEDERQQEIDEEMFAGFRQEEEQLAERIEAKKQELEGVAERVKCLKTEQSPLSQAQQEFDLVKRDHQKFVNLIQAQQEQLKQLKQRVAERESGLAHKKRELAEVQQEIESLRAQVAAQNISVDDVNQMMNERKKLEQMRATAAAQRATMEKEAYELEMKVEEALDCLQSRVHEYNVAAQHLKLIPQTAKRAAGREFEINIDRSAQSPGELCPIDLKGMVIPALQELRETYTTRCRSLGTQQLGLQEQCDSLCERLADKKETQQETEQRISKLEDDFQVVKNAIDADAQLAEKKIEEMKMAAERLKNHGEASVAQAAEEASAAKAAYEQVAKECDAHEQRLREDFNKMLELLTESYHHVGATIKEVRDQIKMAWEEQGEPLHSPKIAAPGTPRRSLAT
ncbi:unnamed protein product [Ostreobium quekettii]|uniref:Kinetochore protein NDC80 n=1 Tax=Ostreobium quekettii TaxID=121088 RepID=A0A8S1IX08_9CHLO|nr:unnamed protein product [Ostreobium quekettii]